MSMHRICTAIVLLALSIGVRYGSAAAYLSLDEMNASRGGNGELKQCSYTCNANNGYINLCPKADGSACTICNLGQYTVYYTAMGGPNCTGNNYMSSLTQTQNCGNQLTGTCVGVGSCQPNGNPDMPCNNPPTVCAQNPGC